MTRPRAFRTQVDRQVARRVRARRRGERSFWHGLGAMGMVGWSVAAPMLLGALLGRWLDGRWPSGHSWTLALMLAGLVLGCWTAATWVTRERRELEEEAKP